MYGCQQVLIKPNQDLRAILEFICEQSNKLADCGTYYARQLYFKTGKIIGRHDLTNVSGKSRTLSVYKDEWRDENEPENKLSDSESMIE